MELIHVSLSDGVDKQDRCSLSLFSVKNAKIVQLKSNRNPNPNFQRRLIR